MLGLNQLIGFGVISNSIKNLLTAGSPAVFESASASGMSVVMLTSTKALVAYSDYANGYFGTACILDVSGNTITAGAPTVFQSVAAYTYSVSPLSSTKAIVVCKGSNNFGTACILDVSGNTITAGTPTVFAATYTEYQNIVTLTDTTALAAYKASSLGNDGTAVVLTISGTTITTNTPYVFESNSANYISLSAISPTLVMVGYSDSSNIVKTLAISGTTITELGNSTLGSATTVPSITKLSTTQALIVYADPTTGDCVARVLNISGSTITAGSQISFHVGASIDPVVSAVSTTKAIVMYTDSSKGMANILDISGTSITPRTPIIVESGTTNSVTMSALSSTKIISAYTDASNSNYGTACVVNII